MKTGKAIPPSKTKRALHLAGTPIFDDVVRDLGFDPYEAAWVEPVGLPTRATPKTVARRVRKKTPVGAA